MDLTDQLVNLELSQKIESLGVKQESLWWWNRFEDEWQVMSKTSDITCSKGKKLEEKISAFTVAELGEMLPSRIKGIGFIRTIKWSNSHFSISIGNIHELDAGSEADARAMMLIHILEEELTEEGRGKDISGQPPNPNPSKEG